MYSGCPAPVCRCRAPWGGGTYLARQARKSSSRFGKQLHAVPRRLVKQLSVTNITLWSGLWRYERSRCFVRSQVGSGPHRYAANGKPRLSLQKWFGSQAALLPTHVGMIMWPKAKRSVSDETAAEIARVAKEHGAQPVGVFVDEDAVTIQQRCQAAGISIAQLHGDPCRACLSQVDASLKVRMGKWWKAASICRKQLCIQM